MRDPATPSARLTPTWPSTGACLAFQGDLVRDGLVIARHYGTRNSPEKRTRDYADNEHARKPYEKNIFIALELAQQAYEAHGLEYQKGLSNMTRITSSPRTPMAGRPQTTWPAPAGPRDGNSTSRRSPALRFRHRRLRSARLAQEAEGAGKSLRIRKASPVC